MDLGVSEWEGNKWDNIGVDDDLPGPHGLDHYNGTRGIKPGIADIFETALQWIFKTTDMDRGLFKIITEQSNKYARNYTSIRNSNLLLRHK